MATGPVGYPGYTMNIADYSSIGGDVAAPGGDYFSASDTVQDAILAAMPANSSIYQDLDPLNPDFPVIVRGDATVQYQKVIEVLDLLRRLELSQVGLVTGKPTQG